MDNLDSTPFWTSEECTLLATLFDPTRTPDVGLDPFPTLPTAVPIQSSTLIETPSPRISTSNSAWGTGPSPAASLATIAPPFPPQRSADPLMQVHSRWSRALSQKDVTITDGVDNRSRGNVGFPKRPPIAFGLINPITGHSPTSESATSKPNQIISPTVNANAQSGPSSLSQNSITAFNFGAGSLQTPSNGPSTWPGSRLPLWKSNSANGTGGGVGVGNRRPPTSRVPDSSLLTPALREALNASITSGCFVDTKIYLFSRRNSAGDICKPKALFANSMVLNSVPYFNDLFSGNYSESATKDLDAVAAEEDAIAENYDYYSDSDLEDVEDLDAIEGLNDNATATDRPHDAIRDGDYISAYYDERMKEGRVIKVQDIAFVTFQAFLLYLYTGRIEFAPFASEENRKSRAAEIISLAPDRVPRPSPKSVYRLADKYDVPTLKSLALDKIKEGMERFDPVRESFSRFASYYPEILGMHIENLASILTEADSQKVQDQLDERLQAFSEGEIDHASDAFSSLWMRLTQGGGGKTPHRTRSSIQLEAPSSTVSSPLSIALIKSVRQGVFFDRRYMAKRENTGKRRSPVYISSVVLGDIDWTLGTLISDLEGGEEDSEGDCDSDSDYEDSMEETSDSMRADARSRSGKEPESVMAATLPTGAFSTWRAVFFYLCTGSIQFAPLKSSGIEARAQYVRENQKPENPPLCSPKSVCHLAGKLGLLHLETTALGDATAKTSVANIVSETFSKSTARLRRLREVQCQLLLSSMRNEEIAKATGEHIRDLAGGKASHRYASFSLGFRMAIVAKRTASSETEGPSNVPGPAIQVSSERENLGEPQRTWHRRHNHPVLR